MLNHTGTLWHYLGSFIFYTLGAIGMIYAIFWYTRKAGGVLGFGPKPQPEGRSKLAIESVLALEPQKNLYVVRAGEQRFLIATSTDGAQCLSPLDALPGTVSEPAPQPLPASAGPELPVMRPWYADSPPSRSQSRHPGAGARFVQSVQWLISARAPRNPR